MLASLRRRRITAVLELAGAAVALVVLMAPGGGTTGTARVELSRAAGTLSLSNSRAGAAIFRAANMRPGAQVSGSVRVADTGTLPARLTLAPTSLVAANQASLLLESELRLTVLDVTRAGRPATVYSGPLTGMTAVALGALPAGRARDFLFVASLPGGAGNALQGARLAAAFRWTATAAPLPSATPAPTPRPQPTPVPTVTPPPGGGTTTCSTVRRVKIRVPRWHGHRARKAVVKVGHGHAHRAKVRHGKVTVKVSGATRVKIKVTVKYAGGHHKVIKRRAPGCSA